MTYDNDPNEQHENRKATWVEELEVTGRDAVGQVKELIAQANVRRIIVRRADGRKIVEFPMTASVVAGSAALVFAPFFSVLTVAVAFLSNVRIEVIRDIDEGHMPDVARDVADKASHDDDNTPPDAPRKGSKIHIDVD